MFVWCCAKNDEHEYFVSFFVGQKDDDFLCSSFVRLLSQPLANEFLNINTSQHCNINADFESSRFSMLLKDVSRERRYKFINRNSSRQLLEHFQRCEPFSVSLWFSKVRNPQKTSLPLLSDFEHHRDATWRHSVNPNQIIIQPNFRMASSTIIDHITSNYQWIEKIMTKKSITNYEFNPCNVKPSPM